MKHWLGLILFAFVLSGGTAMAVEEPAHTVVVREGAFEVRDYPALVAAEVSVTGTRDEASNAGFKLLAGYIFGGNTKKQSIAMTAPVVQTGSEKIAMTAPVIQSGGAAGWTIRFIMPAPHTLETLPTPNDSRVRLVPVAPARFAVVRFSGLASVSDVTRRTGELEAFIARRSLRVSGPSSLARYDPPWTPWFMRRNEVFIPVER
jgi:hypothetical protein